MWPVNFILFTFWASRCVVDCSTPSSCSSTRNPSVNIEPLIEITSEEHEWANRSKLFFIETSGRDHLLHKQACSIESALRNNPDLPIFVLLTSPTLNPEANNATRQLLSRGGGERILFRHVDVGKLILGTPFEGHLEVIHERIQRSHNKFAHWCDVIRLAVIYRLGGTYSDIDVIFLKPIQPYVNFFSSDQKAVKDANGKLRYSAVANGLFNIEKAKSSFLHDVMNYFLAYFIG
eukprot:TRINITY_DN1170_c0_g1_i2.p1 TRINITY_DN1170_c0_g1~~TRINITY_DN1170_c0_g1_i2.p1  ORF type:complete len:234 (+),score=34.56 TRINITY_DN1170_c0_g1_i2:4-705(+)